MPVRHAMSALFLAGLVLAVPAATAQQRVEFQRRSFDRSRFEKPDFSQRPDLPGLEQDTEPAAPEPEPVAPAEPEPAAGDGREFSFSDPAGGGAPDPADGEQAPDGPADAADDSAPSLIDNPKLDEIPTKTYTHPRYHDELLELQKQTGACMFLYFKNPTVPNQKGLCSWFERRIASDIKWRKAMRNYLKLEITLPGNKQAQELAAKYRVRSTPALFVLKPNSVPNRLSVFRFEPGKRPEVEPIETVIEYLKARSTVAYQSLF